MKVNQPNSPAIQNASTSAASEAKKAERVVSPAVEKARAKEAGDVSGAQATISTKAKDMAKAKAAVDNVPDMREERIAALKAQIASGGYKVDATKIADRMVDEHLSAGIG